MVQTLMTNVISNASRNVRRSTAHYATIPIHIFCSLKEYFKKTKDRHWSFFRKINIWNNFIFHWSDFDEISLRLRTCAR